MSSILTTKPGINISSAKELASLAILVLKAWCGIASEESARLLAPALPFPRHATAIAG